MNFFQRWNFIERARQERQLWDAFERGDDLVTGERPVEDIDPYVLDEVSGAVPRLIVHKRHIRSTAFCKGSRTKHQSCFAPSSTPYQWASEEPHK